MTWIELLPALTGCAYLAAALGYAGRREWPWAIAYAGYAFANVGLIWAAIALRSTR